MGGGCSPKISARNSVANVKPRQQRDSSNRSEVARSDSHALVPPTVSPSIRNVGWPTPTGTP